MFGATSEVTYLIGVISATVAITDLTRGKIYNWITLPAMVMGLAFGLLHSGFSGLTESFFAIGLAFILFGWMFFLGVMGAGDVKYLMALGALGGIQYLLHVAIFGVFLGAIFAIGILIYQKKFVSFLHKISVFLFSFFSKGMSTQFPRLDRGSRMPFGVPLAVAAIWIALDNPLVRWGISF